MGARPFTNPAVAAAFDAHPTALRRALLALRSLILEVAEEELGEDGVAETLKWGQPAYHPVRSGVGTTVRVNALKSDARLYAAYFHCQTTLLDSFRTLYPDSFVSQGDRALIFSTDAAPPKTELRHCIALALTYHRRKRKGV